MNYREQYLAQGYLSPLDIVVSADGARLTRMVGRISNLFFCSLGTNAA